MSCFLQRRSNYGPEVYILPPRPFFLPYATKLVRHMDSEKSNLGGRGVDALLSTRHTLLEGGRTRSGYDRR
jgi:hypothetical protein